MTTPPSEWPLEIDPREPIVRGICHPFHVRSDGKLKPAAYDPTPGTDEVSVIRVAWVGADHTKERAKAVATPKKTYTGLAVLTAAEIRQSNACVVDSRSVYPGHSDIKIGIVVRKGDPPPAAEAAILRARTKELAGRSRYHQDGDPTATSWGGSALV
jgi:hypothetical protein